MGPVLAALASPRLVLQLLRDLRDPGLGRGRVVLLDFLRQLLGTAVVVVVAAAAEVVTADTRPAV